MAALKLDAANISTNRCAHAALLLIFLSDELERAHPEVAQTLNAWFQTRLERPVDFSDLCRFPSIGANAYNAEEIAWCQATIEFLGDELSDEGRVKRGMPPKKRLRGRAASSSGPVPPPPRSPAALRNPSTGRRRVTSADTEDEEDNAVLTEVAVRRGRQARYIILCTYLVFVFTYFAYRAYSTYLSYCAYFEFALTCFAYCAYLTYLSYCAYFKLSGHRRSISTTPAKRQSKEIEIVDEEHTSGSAKKHRKSNADGLALTKSGRVSVSRNDVNAKFDASYRNSANLTKLLGRSVTLGQACGIIGVALHGPDLPLEDAGNILHILHILHIFHILYYIVCAMCFQATTIGWSSSGLLLGMLLPKKSWKRLCPVNLNRC
jgi:hypothetical protein